MKAFLEKGASPALAPALLLAVAFALYAGTFGHGWTYDDFPVIVENADVKSWASFLADGYPGRPLRELTFLLDHTLFGLDPAGYRLQNIFWHGLNAGLLFLLALRLGAGKTAAWISAALFLVHPIQVEVVANTSHRKDSLALAFSLLSVLAYREAFVPGGRRWGWLAGAVLLAAIAFVGKETAIVLPAVWVAWERGFLPREERLLARPASLGVLLVAGAIAAWNLLPAGGDYFRKMASILAMKANYFGPPDLGVYLCTVLKSWSFMASKIVLPLDFAVEYTFPVPTSWGDPWVVGGAMLTAAWGGGLFLARRRTPVLFFGLACSALFWLPVSNLWPLSYLAADRYLYAPSAGFFLVAGVLAGRFGGERPRLVRAVASPALLLLCLLTLRQSTVWASEESLWANAYRVSPRSSFALNNVGNIELLKGNLPAARELYGKSVEVNPWNPSAHYNLGMIAEQVGQLPAALDHYRRFLALDDPVFRAQAGSLRGRLFRDYGVRLD